MAIYLKFSDGYIIPADRVEECTRREYDEKLSSSLVIEREGVESKSMVKEYTDHLTTCDLSTVNVYQDSACKQLIMACYGYTYISNILCRLQKNSVLHTIILRTNNPETSSK